MLIVTLTRDLSLALRDCKLFEKMCVLNATPLQATWYSSNFWMYSGYHESQALKETVTNFNLGQPCMHSHTHIISTPGLSNI